MPSRALIDFRERPYQVVFQDFRVWIQGVEVTPWVQGSLTITQSNRDGFGTASFQLDNALDRFILTDQNLQGVWRDTNDRYSEAAKHGIYLYKTGASEVTIDRVALLTAEIFADNLSTVRQSVDQNTRDLSALDRKKNRTPRNLARRDSELGGTEEQQLGRAADLTAQDLPADAIQNQSPTVKSTLAEQMQTEGLSGPRAKEIADTVVDARRDELTRAGGKRPAGDDPPVETNPDGSSAERKGRHKRQRSIRNPVDPDTGDARWPLQERSVIFHKNDPVRIFVQNPYTETTHWTYGFAGFVDQYPVQTDYVTGQSNLSIQCYDVRALMQKMRVSQNVLKGTQAPEPLLTDRSSIFADLLLPSRWGQAFANLSFENAMALLTTGTDLQGKGDSVRFGVGSLSVGKIVTYPVTEDPTEAVNRATLEEWHTLVLNGPNSIADRIADLTPLTDRDVRLIGSGTTSDGPYNPLAAKVHFLLPKDGTGARELTQQTFDTGTEQRDWTTRFQIVSDFCARLDYEFFVAPTGDLCFEFPMYDFEPDDFGAYANLFRLDQHLISGNIKDEGGDIVTAVVCTGGAQKPQLDPFSNAPQVVIPRAIVQSSLMASRVGITIEQVSLPFTYNAARLRSLALVEFQKRLAAANEIDQEFGYRPYITPNRPLLNSVDKRIGITSSVTNTIQVFQTGSTSAALRFVRHIRSDGTYRFITGGDSMPISYRKIFPGGQKSVGNAKVGVRTFPEFDGEPSALEDVNTTVATPSPERNDDRPPNSVAEARPGTYFALAPSARVVAEQLSRTTDQFLLTNIPRANGTSFAIRARDPEGHRIFSDTERASLAARAKTYNYLLTDTGERFEFSVRRPNQPDLVVKHG